MIMMPKPMLSEKKIWPNAAAHTDASAKAAQCGVKRVLSPSAAPGRNSDRTTRIDERDDEDRDEHRGGQADAPLHAERQHADHQQPRPPERHEHACHRVAVTPGSLVWRNSVMKNAPGSAPHFWSIEKNT